jgi:Asp-tRNA(Asn)/Glu-tRNA(Gln) amidotransferase A subunit family amidase
MGAGGLRINAPHIDLFTPATVIAAAVRAGEASAKEIVQAMLERIASLDADLGCFTVVLAEEALAAAASIDSSHPKGTLAGVPVAVKDHIWMAGAPATNGSRALKDFVPAEDCAAVARLRQAGAVILGKTNNPEFCYSGDTSPLWGSTRNPYNLGRTPFGSSSGSAAAVAAGLTTIAMGTDGGGSIRAPSAFCGTVGHKPSFGLVPKLPGFIGWPTLSVHGPMGRTVEDVATMLTVMSGAHSADPATAGTSGANFAEAICSRENLAGLTIAVSEDLGIADVEPEIRHLFRRAVDVIQSLGCEIEEIHPRTDNPAELWWTIAAAESFASEGFLLDREEELTPYSVNVIRSGEGMTAGAYLAAQECRKDLCRKWAEAFEQFDLIVYPATSVLPFPLGWLGPGGKDDESWFGMDAVANLTGQPALALPCGLSAERLPVGIQIMGPRFSDTTVISAAAVIERHFERATPPAPYGRPTEDRATH